MLQGLALPDAGLPLEDQAEDMEVESQADKIVVESDLADLVEIRRQLGGQWKASRLAVVATACRLEAASDRGDLA